MWWVGFAILLATMIGKWIWIIILIHQQQTLRSRLNAVRCKLQEIGCMDGEDAGVIYLSSDSPSHWSDRHKCYVYEHQYFSPLGDALIATYKLTELK